MAVTVGVSPASVRRIWKTHGLKPHRGKTFKRSNDKHGLEKLNTIVGLYLAPPEHALVLSGDEKSPIPALDRTQPGWPLKKGRCGTMTHDDKRHGTTTLFAALNTLNGPVLSTCMKRHRHPEWIKFLRRNPEVCPPRRRPAAFGGPVNLASEEKPPVSAGGFGLHLDIGLRPLAIEQADAGGIG